MQISGTAFGRKTFLAGSAAAAACGLPSALRAAPGDLPVVNLGCIPADVSAVAVYAQQLGYFKNAGLDVRITTMNSGPVIATAVTGGTLDVGAMNAGTLASARARGVPLRFFAPAAVSSTVSTDVIMVRKDSTIRDGADLNNKTVAIVAMRTMQDAAFRLWVDKHGGDSKTIKLIEIPFPEMIGALDQGRVDAAIPSEPFTSQGRANNKVIGSVYDAMPPHFLIFGFFATDQWLAAHPDVAAKFAGAIRQAAVWANGHQKESAEMLATFAKMDPQIASSIGRATYGTTITAAMLQPVIDNAVRYGMLDKAIDPNELIWQPGKA